MKNYEAYKKIRRVWTINPKTFVSPNRKKQKSRNACRKPFLDKELTGY